MDETPVLEYEVHRHRGAKCASHLETHRIITECSVDCGRVTPVVVGSYTRY